MFESEKDVADPKGALVVMCKKRSALRRAPILRRNALWLLRSTVLCLVLILLCPKEGFAQTQYCAQRVMVAPPTQCFNTLSEAQAFIRVEPVPENGSKYLDPSRVNQHSLGYFSTYYAVQPKRYDNFVGSLHTLFTIGGWGRSEYDCGYSNIIPGATLRGCPDEQTASNGFLQRYPFEGSNASAYFSGSYMPDPAD